MGALGRGVAESTPASFRSHLQNEWWAFHDLKARSRLALWLPNFSQRTITPQDRVLAWSAYPSNRVHILIVFFHRGPAFVVGSVGRISTYYEEGLARRKALMTGAGRKDYGIAGLQLEDAAFIAPETHRCASASDAKNFVNPRVIMEIIVDAIAPRIAPSI